MTEARRLTQLARNRKKNGVAKIRKRLAIAAARNHAARLVENKESQ